MPRALEPQSVIPNQDIIYEQLAQKEIRPVLAFRGSTDAVDWADDVSPEGVGAFQFSAHEGEIAGAIAAYAGCDTTGHSLGGALAMLAATLGGVNRVVTFQAPGISEEALNDPDLQGGRGHPPPGQ